MLILGFSQALKSQEIDSSFDEYIATDPSEEFQIGEMYFNGKDVEQDYYKAITWYEKAGNKNHIESQEKLGMIYESEEYQLQNLDAFSLISGRTSIRTCCTIDESIHSSPRCHVETSNLRYHDD